MCAFPNVRQWFSDRLEHWSFRVHRSDLGRHRAPAYTRYLERCRAGFRGPLPTGSSDAMSQAAARFDRDGSCALWTPEQGRLADAIYHRLRAEEAEVGPQLWNDDGSYSRDVYLSFPEVECIFRGTLGDLLVQVYGCHFKIYSCTLFRSERRREERDGSEIWHVDSGPGTCINVLMYLHSVAAEHGALECLPWDASLAVFRHAPRALRAMIPAAEAERGPLSRVDLRALKCRFFEEEVARRHAGRVLRPTGPAGLAVLFYYNTLHRGGYPEAGFSRYACVFHCYPSHKPPPYARYRITGIPKRGPRDYYPADPADES